MTAPAAMRSGPSASTMSTVTKVPTVRSVGHVHDPVDLGGFSMGATDADLVDQHLDRPTDQGVPTGGGDRVLELGQLAPAARS